MNSFKKLSHSIYEFKYHTVFCPKHLYRIFEDQIGQYAKGSRKNKLTINKAIGLNMATMFAKNYRLQ